MAVAWTLFLSWTVVKLWVEQQNSARVEELLRGIAIAILVFTSIVLFEVVTNQAIHHFLINKLGMPMSIPNYYAPTVGHYNVMIQFLNQHMGTLSYVLWPILLTIYLTFGKKRFVYMCFFAIAASYSILHSENQTAILALILSAVAFSAALVVPRATEVLIAIFFSLGVLAIVPITYLAHDTLQLQSNPFIPLSGQARIPIWYNVASAVGERRLFGHGVVDLQALLDLGHGFIWEHAHAHSVLLQNWYEGGAVGAALFLVLGLLSLRLIYRCLGKNSCFGAAAFVAVIVSFSTTAWEIWVPWHLGLMSFVAILGTLLAELSKSGVTRTLGDERVR